MLDLNFGTHVIYKSYLIFIFHFSGQKFAMMELKSTFAHILNDFYLEPVTRLADMKMTLDIVIRPKDPVIIKFVKINKK